MEEKVFFQNSKGDKLVGILSNPSGNTKKPVIVLCHGFNSGKDGSTNISLKGRLDKNNISSFRFDFFAHGESEGSFEDLTVSEATDDILQAINFLKNRGYPKIGLEGSSFGGLAALIASSGSKDIYLLAVKCPVSSYMDFAEYANPGLITEWKKQGYDYRENKKLKYAFYEDVKKNIAYHVAAEIKVPTLVVHGDSDTEVPIEQSKKLSALIPDCRLKIIRGAGHYFGEGESRRQMIEALTNFIVDNSTTP